MMTTPIQSKYLADILLENIERRVVHEENKAKDYLETFYRALVDNGLMWPSLDFNDLMTTFRASKELIILPTLEMDNLEQLKHKLRVSLYEEHIAKDDYILLTTLSPLTLEIFDNEQYLTELKSGIDKNVKLFTALISSEKRWQSRFSYIGTMIIHHNTIRRI